MSGIESKKYKMKPCPFCGSKAIIQKRNLCGKFSVACSFVLCPVSPSTYWSDDKQQIIDAWNGRASDEE